MTPAVPRPDLCSRSASKSINTSSQIDFGIIGVELPEAPQPFLAVCSTLLQSEINISYTYPMLYRRDGRGGIALYVDDIERGLELLADTGHRLISEDDLLRDDEFF